MTLTDAGPLIAILHRSDALHSATAEAMKHLVGTPLLPPLPCFSEAMHLLFRRMGVQGQQRLWQWWQDGHLELHLPSAEEIVRMSELMSQYSDLPMDLGDASLIAAAEVLGESRLFTFDQHFRIYKLADGSVMELVP